GGVSPVKAMHMPHYLSTHAVLAHVSLAGTEPSAALGVVELKAASAKSYQRGKCLFEVSYEVKNDGPSTTMPFNSSVSVRLSYQEPHLPSLAAGQVVPVTLLAPFQPGENRVAILAFNKATQVTDQTYWHRMTFVHGSCAPPSQPAAR